MNHPYLKKPFKQFQNLNQSQKFQSFGDSVIFKQGENLVFNIKNSDNYNQF